MHGHRLTLTLIHTNTDTIIITVVEIHIFAHEKYTTSTIATKIERKILKVEKTKRTQKKVSNQTFAAKEPNKYGQNFYEFHLIKFHTLFSMVQPRII